MTISRSSSSFSRSTADVAGGACTSASATSGMSKSWNGLPPERLTKHAAATTLPPPYIALTLTAYLVVYGLLLSAYIYVIFYLARKMSRGEDIGTRIAPAPAAAPNAIPAQ